ncbi:MAG: flavodoxin family protein [Candidatus Ranarchaeia archaeon]|jgi:multimeric flavodoxin WrbA
MHPIYLVGINGSARDEATEAVLKKGLQIAQKQDGVTTRQLNLREFKFSFCIHCDKCLDPEYFKKTGYRCQHNDDLEKIYPEILKADSLIIATPVYTGNPSGLFWSFFNRLRPLDPHIKESNKTISFITVGGSQRNGTDSAMMALMRIVIHKRLLYVPSGSRGCVGVQIVSRNPPGEPLSSGRVGAMQDKIGMNALEDMIPKLINHTQLIKAGEKALGIKKKPVDIFKGTHLD